ncbi:hypothetical protein [Aestuariivirga sp.]|uniref:hypothetical protein n=1 Tax=Aestuariivirga sp. TaxID=2650926 RepID=UPI0039E69849
MRSRANAVLFLLLFVLPLLAVTVYELRIATDRYHSDSAITISKQDGGSTSSAASSLLGLVGGGSSGGNDPLVLLQFVQSVDMLQYLDAKMNLRAHYSDPKVDWFSRMPASYSLEQFHDYIAHYITATYDLDSGMVFLHVESFNREYSQALLNAILERSQIFVDRLNDKINTEQTSFFEQQLAASEKRMRDVRDTMLAFQRDNRLLTTQSEAILVTTNIGDIEKSLIGKQSQLEARLTEVSASSPIIQSLKSDIASLKTQLDNEKRRLAGSSDNALSELDAKFKEMQFNLDFLTGVYKSNLTQLETARMAAAERRKFLVVVTQPSIADSSIYPDHVYVIGTAAMILIMVFFIISLLIAIIREHT